ncbi:MAG: 4'-phosphopantetheinyl transferase [Polyangia bacterium]
MPFERRFTARLPFGVCVGVALPDAVPAESDWPALLHPDERDFARGLAEPRRASWIGGRVALRAALDAAGLSSREPLLATARGGPRLPAGATGSISHKSDLAVAIAAPVGQPPATVGIDLEQLRPLRVDVSARVLTPGERDGLPLPGPQRDAHILRLFCAKEAVYKALDPWLGRYVAFQEVEIHDGLAVRLTLSDGAGPFAVALAEPVDLAPGGYVLMTAVARLG